MSVTELCLVVIALSAVAATAVAAILVSRIGALIRRYEELAEAATRTTQELDGLIADVRVMVRDVKGIQGRVSHVASEILTLLEPSLSTVSAVVTGLRSGLTALLGLKGPRRDTLPGDEG